MWILSTFLLLFVYLSWTDVAHGANEGGVVENCTILQGSESRACYVCMGRDQYNCDWGFTCCNGPCFKLIDDKHNVIAKGCAESGTDGSMTPDITLEDSKLPWEEDESIVGNQYYCDQGLILLKTHD